jgi:hypothetical protein
LRLKRSNTIGRGSRRSGCLRRHLRRALRGCLDGVCLGDGCWRGALGLKIGDLALLLEALAGAWEAIFKLGLREAVVETVAGGLHIGGEGARARRLSALNQNQGKRNERKQRDPAPSVVPGATATRWPDRVRHSRRAGRTRTITALEFRICPDHPPIAPTFNGDRISARWSLGDVKLPGKNPHTRHDRENTKSCRDCGIVTLFSQSWARLRCLLLHLRYLNT